MTPNAVKEALQRLLGAFPGATVDEETALVWADALRPVDTETGLLAVGHLIRTEARFPPLSRVLEACRAQERRKAASTAALPEAADVRADRIENGLRRVRGLRRELAETQPWTPDRDDATVQTP